jgi:hypothetical protein
MNVAKEEERAEYSSLWYSGDDAGLHTDVAILVFSKAFDTVPHNKLLHKLDDYSVRGSINRWLEEDRQKV